MVLARPPWPHRVRTVDAVVAQLADVGIEVEVADVNPVEFPCGAWDVGMLAFFTTPAWWHFVSTHDLVDPASPPMPDNPFANLLRWGTPAVTSTGDDCFDVGASSVQDEYTDRMTEIVETLRTSLDPDVLRPLVEEAESIAADQALFVPLYVWPKWVLWNPMLAGFGVATYDFNLFWNAERWYRTDG
jgi:ABC-type transport system substrate-binding protein